MSVPFGDSASVGIGGLTSETEHPDLVWGIRRHDPDNLFHRNHNVVP